MEPFCEVGNTQYIIRLAGEPGSGQHLVIKTDHYRPAAGDFGKAVDHVGCSVCVVHRVVKAVQWTPGPRVDQIFQALPDGHGAALIDLLRGKTRVFDVFLTLFNSRLNLLQLFHAWSCTLDPDLFQLFAELLHVLKIRPHKVLSSI